MRDDEPQAQAVYRCFRKAEAERERFFVPLVVLLETVWVLESAYDRSAAEVLSAVADLRHMSILEFGKGGVVDRVLRDARNGRLDFADLLISHVAQACDCESGMTFDRGVARLPFFRLLK